MAMLDLAASTGDTRLSMRAEHLLAAYPERNSSTEILVARAFAAQHRHDFYTALRYLDRIIAADPRSGAPLLSRAQIRIVQGSLQKARSDCGALMLRVDASLGALCAASLAFRSGRYVPAAELVERWLAHGGGDRNSRRYALVLRGEIASRAGDPSADTWFQRAIDLSPEDVRTLAAYARHLRQSGRPARGMQLLASAPRTDSLLLERALSARLAGHASAPLLAAELGRRFALARATGNPTELRDEAEYRLALRGDPEGALALALRNFETQRDAEDVDLLLRAAHAAGRPEALAGLNTWARSQGLSLPARVKR